MNNNIQFLFSYGTLQLENVQLANYGRILKGRKDCLPKYKLDNLKITDQKVIEKSKLKFHPIAIKTDIPYDFIEGTIFEITELELEETDKYEVSDYKRVLETFSSGQQAWVYVATQNKSLSTIEENIVNVRKRIEKACQYSKRNPNEIKLL